MRKWLGAPQSLSDVALYAKDAKLKLPFTSLVEEFQVAKVRLQLMLRDSRSEAAGSPARPGHESSDVFGSFKLTPPAVCSSSFLDHL